MKTYTILHISDFHKDKDQHFDNLLLSLRNDAESYVNEQIPKPEIIVISGDLVQGVRKTDESAKQELKRQYEEVAEFLEKLVVEFLNGDKRRLIIVPGNHDIFRAHTISSMKISDECDYKKDKEIYFKGDCDIRWSWDNKAFFYVINKDVYKTRFEAFIEFYNTFYQNVEHRQLPNDIDDFAYLVDLEEYGITFVGFNSCDQLDHLNVSGRISPSALTLVSTDIREKYLQGRLICGVWHHHVNGLPPERNYLDYRILNSMIKNHIHMGLFGHQHQSQILQEYADFTQDKKMLLASTGTLYGRHKALRSGLPRQYNLITILRDFNEIKLAIRVREDRSVDSYDIPNWQPYIHGETKKSVFEYKIEVALPSFENQIREAEKEAKENRNYEAACLKLKRAGLKNPIALALYDEYIGHLEANQIIHIIEDVPMNEKQYTYLLSAAVEVHDAILINKLLSIEFLKFQTPLNKDIREKALKEK